MIEERVRELKAIIAGNDGHNAADARFTRAVDELVSAVYAEIGEIKRMSTRTLFDLFVIKVLYVGRHSRHADVVDYLGELLDRFVSTRELFPEDEDGRPRHMYFSDMIDPEKAPHDVPNVFEAYRKYADSALFLSGMFPASSRRSRPSGRTPLRRRQAPAVDMSYYVSTGKAMYRMSARDGHADCDHHAQTLDKLALHFEVYVDALNEMSERYIMGFDTGVIGDLMLDALNRHKSGGAGRDLLDARRYAALLHIDHERFPLLPHEAD